MAAAVRENRMPRPVQSPRIGPTVIYALATSLKRFQEEEDDVRKEFPWATRFVMGLPLAPWQRPLKWNAEQCARFITSAWTGIHLGHYILTDMALEAGTDLRHQPLSECVLDGQQRLHALELYLTNQLSVPDANGAPMWWGDLDVVERRWFMNRHFSRGTVPLTSEAELRELYNLMNFGGVAHEESERA